MHRGPLALFALAICALLTRPARTVRGVEDQKAAATLPIPQDYRRWIYLTSGLDMTYTATTGVPAPPNHDGQFDNVFVNPEAYTTFTQSGTWPSGTTFVLENRGAKRNVSINKAGRTQGSEITGIELHVKSGDEWTFYVRRADGQEHLLPKPASCYTCHEAHGAVDTTFVQFYPTLLPVAESRNLFSPAYLAEEKAAASK